MTSFQFWPVIAGTITATLLGLVWHLYTPNGRHRADRNTAWRRPAFVLGTLFGNLLYASTIEVVAISLNTFSLVQGASLGIVIGAGIALPTLLLNNVYRGTGWSNSLIAAAYPICCLVIIGAISGVWPRN